MTSGNVLDSLAAELLTDVVLPFTRVSIDPRLEGAAESRQCTVMETGLHGLSLQGEMRDTRSSSSEGSAYSAVDSASPEAKLQDADDSGTSRGSGVPPPVAPASAEVDAEQVNPTSSPGECRSSPEHMDEVIDLDSPERRPAGSRTASPVKPSLFHSVDEGFPVKQTDELPTRSERGEEAAVGREVPGEGGSVPGEAGSAMVGTDDDADMPQAQGSVAIEDSDDDDLEFLGSGRARTPPVYAYRNARSEREELHHTSGSQGPSTQGHHQASAPGEGRGSRFWVQRELEHMAQSVGLSIDPNSGFQEDPLGAYLNGSLDAAGRRAADQAAGSQAHEPAPAAHGEDSFDELLQEDESSSEEADARHGGNGETSTSRVAEDEDSDDDVIELGSMPPQGTTFASKPRTTLPQQNIPGQGKPRSVAARPSAWKATGLPKKVTAAAAFRFSARAALDASDDEGEEDVVMADADAWAAAAKNRKHGSQGTEEHVANGAHESPCNREQKKARAVSGDAGAGPSSWAFSERHPAGDEVLQPDAPVVQSAAASEKDMGISDRGQRDDEDGHDSEQPGPDGGKDEEASTAQMQGMAVEDEGREDGCVAAELTREQTKETAEYKQAQDEVWRQRQEVIQRQLVTSVELSLHLGCASPRQKLLEGQPAINGAGLEAALAQEREVAQQLKRKRKEQLLAEQRKQESEARQKRRLEEVRTQQNQEAQRVASKEQMRSAVAADLELRTKNCSDLGAALVRLGIAVEGQPKASEKQVMDAYKKALRKFHPDSISRNGITDPSKQVEAEEAFKLIQRLKASLPLTAPAAPPLYEDYFSHSKSFTRPWGW